MSENRFYSDDPSVYPDGTITVVLDWKMNLQRGIAVWQDTAVIHPDGLDGTFEGIGIG